MIVTIKTCLCLIGVAGLVNAGIYLTLIKWRVIDWYTYHKKNWMPSCEFCFYFWVSFIELVILFSFVVRFSLASILASFVLAFGAAALSRFIRA